MARIRRTVRFSDGLVVRRLPHFQCGECDAAFFDDAAMEVIERAGSESGNEGAPSTRPAVLSATD